MKMRIVYLFFIWGTPLGISCKDAELSEKPASGPFQTTLVTTVSCTKPSRPYVQPPAVAFEAQLYNSSQHDRVLLSGNLTLLRNLQNMMLTIKRYHLEDDKWVLRYMFKNIGCNGVVISLITSMFSVKFGKNCSINKGNIFFKNVDFDKVEHMVWASSREYGRMLWKSEVFIKTGTILCWESETVVTPL